MAGVVVPQAKQKDDPLAIVMKGLSIARDVYGIRADSQRLDDAKLKAEDEKAGVLSPKELLQYSQHYDRVPVGTPGALNAATRVDGKVSPLAFAVRAEPTKYKTVTTRNADGSETIKNMPENFQEVLTSAAPVKKEDKVKPELINTTDEKGNPIQKWVFPKVGESYAAKDEKPNEAQSQAATFGKRAVASHEIVNNLLEKGYDPSSALKLKNDLPVIGNFISNKDDQLFNQAKRNFVSAVLRDESGASISKEERASEELKYFPQPGDGPDVIAQKSDDRLRAIAGLQAQAGKSWDKVQTIASKKTGASGNWGEAVAAPTAKTDTTIEKYAKDHGLDYQASRAIMVKRGYKPNE